MSQQTGTPPPSATGGSSPRAQVARDEAAELGRTTADAGHHVAGVAGEQAAAVANETRRQVQDLLGEARTQATDQARAGQQRATEGLRSLAGELHQMADGGDSHGPASDLAAQAAERIDGLAGWLERHEPGDLLGEVRRYARSRPGTFLLGAAVAGVLAGRLTRGAVDANRDSGPAGGSSQPVSGPVPQQAVPHPAVPYPPVPGQEAPAPYAPPVPAGPPPYAGTPMPPPQMPPPHMPPAQMPPSQMPPPRMPPPGPPGGPGYPPPVRRAEPGRPTSTGPTTVGEYVEEIEQGQPRHELRNDPRDRP